MIAFVLASVGLTAGAGAREPLRVSDDLRAVALLDHVEVLEDPTRRLEIADVASGEWASRFAPPDSLTLGYSDSAWWLRFSLRNPTPRDVELLLKVDYPQLDDLRLFAPDASASGFTKLEGGDARPRDTRTLPVRNDVFPIVAPGSETRTFYLRVESGSVVSVPLELSAVDGYIAQQESSLLLLGLFYGSVLGLLAYNLFIYHSTREVVQLYYAGASAGFVLYFAQMDGLLNPLWGGDGWFQSRSVFGFVWLAGVCILQFGRRFLETGKHLPRFDRVLSLYLKFLLALPLCAPFVELSTLGEIVVFTASIGFVLPVAAYAEMRAGFKPALPYLVAWTPLLAVAPWLAVSAIGIAPGFIESIAAFRLMFVAERVLMSTALAQRVKTLSEEKLELSLEALSARAEALAESEERRRVEHVLKDREAQLLQSQKMEAVGRLAGGVAHDFNNLLTVIQGNAEMLADAVGSRDEAELAREIVDGADHAVDLTRQLLAFSRRSTGRVVRLDPNRTIGNLQPMLARLLGENVELVAELDPWVGRVEADVGHFEQIIVNLAVNARDAMPDGGRITIATRQVEIDEATATAFDLPGPGDYVSVSVTDTGSGMDEETRTRMFEPFFTTKGVGEGTGLGLSTVYGIVKQAGGEVRVESGPGEGACFEIWLPGREVEVQDEPERIESPAVGIPRGSETILLVEDEPKVLELMRSRLESLGYRVLAATGGEQAFKLFEAAGGSVALVLSDVVMPAMSGPELCGRLRAVRPSLPVAFMSGYPRRPGSPNGQLEPEAAYLQKPASLADLARAVRKAIDRA